MAIILLNKRNGEKKYLTQTQITDLTGAFTVKIKPPNQFEG